MLLHCFINVCCTAHPDHHGRARDRVPPAPVSKSSNTTLFQNVRCNHFAQLDPMARQTGIVTHRSYSEPPFKLVGIKRGKTTEELAFELLEVVKGRVSPTPSYYTVKDDDVCKFQPKLPRWNR